MNLALFDLDHTLIPFDSGMAWTRFLVARGVLPAAAEATYLQHCRDYVAGTLDIRAMYRASVTPLAGFHRATIAEWGVAFGATMAPRVPEEMRRCVERHRTAGDLCAIVTATSRFVAEPFARLFGVENVLATEPAAAANGHYTGEIDGVPCFRDGKLVHVQRWLAARSAPPQPSIGSFGRSWFYSDSSSDLPLLEAVSHPVAVRPDQRLRARAESSGWTIVD